MKFKEIMSLVLTVLGIEAFAKGNDGKVFLTDEQKAELTEKYGEKFVADTEFVIFYDMEIMADHEVIDLCD